MTNHKQKEKFICSVPISFQDKIAISSYQKNLINCTEKFEMEFKPGDSIYVFEEQDTWTLGIKWGGGGLIYKPIKQ